MEDTKKPPKGITFHAVYAPDMDRMVEALKIVLNSRSTSEKTNDSPQKETA